MTPAILTHPSAAPAAHPLSERCANYPSENNHQSGGLHGEGGLNNNFPTSITDAIM